MDFRGIWHEFWDNIKINLSSSTRNTEFTQENIKKIKLNINALKRPGKDSVSWIDFFFYLSLCNKINKYLP